MPRPANADSRCSTVEMRTSPSISDVDKVVSPTFSARARISTGGFISTRRNTMPASTAAGRRVRYTFSPLWRPTPVARITFFSVLCLLIRVTLSVSPAGTTPRVWRHGSIAASAYPILGPADGRLSIRLATQVSGNIQVLEIASFRRRGCTLSAVVGYLVLLADHGGPFKLRVIGLAAAVVILVGQLDRLLLRLVLAAEAGGHHRHPQFIGHLRVDYSTYDHRGVVGCKFLDGIADFFEFTDRHVEAGGDVHQDALGAHEIDILQQRAVHRRLGCLACAILAGGAPIVAQAARELGILTVAVVTKPFPFEGKKRLLVAEQGIKELSQYVDSLITIPNEKLLSVLGKSVSLLDAFKAANNVLQGAVQGIAELITRPGLINVDFADVRTVMSEMGMAMMGSGRATGQDRARKAAEAAVNSPLLEDINLMGAKGILVNVTAGLDMAIGEFEEVGNTIKEFASDNATVVVGTVIDPQMSNELRVTVLATGLGREDKAQEQPVKPAYKDNNSSSETDYAQLERPTVIRHQNKVANGGRYGAAAAAEGSDLEYLDIPAFLRRQAD